MLHSSPFPYMENSLAKNQNGKLSFQFFLNRKKKKKKTKPVSIVLLSLVRKGSQTNTPAAFWVPRHGFPTGCGIAERTVSPRPGKFLRKLRSEPGLLLFTKNMFL